MQTDLSSKAPITLILAAGKSTRFPGNKLFTPLLNQTLLHYTIKKALILSPDSSFLLLSPDQKNQEENLLKSFPSLHIMYQENANGTGGAVESFLTQYFAHTCAHCPKIHSANSDYAADQPLLVLFGDTPLIQESTLQTLQQQSSIHNILLAFKSIDNNHHYGKIVLDKNQYVANIIEYKEKDTYQNTTTEFVSSGIFLFNTNLQLLYDTLKTLPVHAHGEKYLTDLCTALYTSNKPTKLFEIKQEEAIGINTMQDFHQAQQYLHSQLIEKHIKNGVFIHNPALVTLSCDTILEPGCQIHPYTIFGPKCHIRSTATILPFSYITESDIGGIVGPFAYVRANTTTQTNTHIGSFVETKDLSMNIGAKAKHHSYLGNATVGTNTNIGAGVIICNYNKQSGTKTPTNIGDNCDIGANSCLIAPLNIQSNSQVGAGSVISKEVESNTLAVTRTPQKNLRLMRKYSE